MARSSGVVVAGPLAAHVEGFAAHLSKQGYTEGSARQQLQLIAHVSRWLATQDLQASDLSEPILQRFVAARCADHVRLSSPRALEPLVEYLRGVGAVPVAVRAGAGTPVELLLDEFGVFLRRDRGLAMGSTRLYQDAVRPFLTERVVSGRLDLSGLRAAQVSEFVLASCRVRAQNTAALKTMVTALRALLRFLYLRGLTPTPLVGAVPTVAGWRAGSLPHRLDAHQVARMLASCDRSSLVGVRDFAVLTLLARLGLRVHEVAGLTLDDLDWRGGEILIRGKGQRTERMPLPDDVGTALASYVHRRPRLDERRLFLRIRAPQGPLPTSGVRSVVRHACDRAGLARVGAHRLRHFAATETLRAGATLPEVAQLLRHESLTTTAVYAKVDTAALRPLALPWPGGAA